MKTPGWLVCTAGVLLALCAQASFAIAQSRSHHAAASKAAAAAPAPAVKQLDKLCEQLKQKNSPAAYSALSALANQKTSPLATRSGSDARRRIRFWATTHSTGPPRRIWPSIRTQPLWLN
jgi:hypothetical protein